MILSSKPRYLAAALLGLATATLAQNASTQSYDTMAQQREYKELIDEVHVNPATATASTDGFQPRLVRGAPTMRLPAIGAILIGAEDVLTQHCTGTLIGSRHVITAAHCFDDDDNGANYRVFFQGVGLFEVEPEVAIADGYTESTFPKSDIAIMKLKTAVRGIELPSVGLPAGFTATDQITLVGFGRTGATRGNAGIKRAGFTNDTNCRPIIADLADDLVCWKFDPTLPARPGEYSSTCKGDSGGPTMRGVHGRLGWFLVAVHSGARHPRYETEFCENIRIAYAADVHKHLQWIKNTIGGDLGQIEPEEFPNRSVLLQTDWKLSGGTAGVRKTAPLSVGADLVRVTMNGEDHGQRKNFTLTVSHRPTGGTPTVVCEFNKVRQFDACELRDLPAGELVFEPRSVKGSGLLQVNAAQFNG